MRDQILLERAKAMRKELTEPERRLWNAFRAKRLGGASFRRQVVIGNAIADFACRSPRMLVVEVDGETPAGQQSYDAGRTRCLELRGYHALRFTNSEIMTNLEGVLLTIQRELRTPPLPNHRAPLRPFRGKGQRAIP